MNMKGIDTTIQQTLQSMQLDGPALLESVANQIASSKDSFQRAASAGGGALQPEERSALEAQAADLQAQQQDIQRRLDSLGRRPQAGGDDRPRLEPSRLASRPGRRDGLLQILPGHSLQIG